MRPEALPLELERAELGGLASVDSSGPRGVEGAHARERRVGVAVGPGERPVGGDEQLAEREPRAVTGEPDRHLYACALAAGLEIPEARFRRRR